LVAEDGMAVKGAQAVGQFGMTLIVQDVAAAADFYRDVIGATEIRRHRAHNHGEAPGEEVLAAEMQLAGVYLKVVKENPRWREAPRPDWPRSPLSAGAPSTGIDLYVDDVDELFTRAVEAGASPQIANRGPENAYWGDRIVQFYDPFGHFWRVLTRLEEVGEDELPTRFQAQCEAYREAKRGTA
jgi:PhnB protein